MVGLQVSRHSDLAHIDAWSPNGPPPMITVWVYNALMHHGGPPWPCHFCDVPVESVTRGVGSVHHLDHDRSNNDVSNLVFAHQACHARYHVGVTDIWLDPDFKARRSETVTAVWARRTPEERVAVGSHISAALTGRRLSEEHRAKLTGRKLSEEHKAKLRGRPLSEDHRQKLSAAGRGRVHSPETRAKISAGNLGKTVSDEARAKVSASQRSKTRCKECGREYNPSWMTRHKLNGSCK